MFKAMVKKEFLLVFRDKHAIMALFVMPAVFILIMSVAMRDQFNSKSVEFRLSLDDIDKSVMSEKIITNIKKDKKFVIVKDNQDANFVLKIPDGYENNESKKIEIAVLGSIKSDQIEACKGMLLEHILGAKLSVLTKNIEDELPDDVGKLPSINVSSDDVYSVTYNDSEDIPNSTQQSVPSWIVFGMFFVIIPLSTIYVNERKQNTLSRLSSMNVSVLSLVVSKTLPYIFINQVQVVIMLFVGIYIVPLFDTPALEINGSLVALGAVSLSLSIAAVGISSLIAVSAKSSEVATTVGGLLNILFGAIGGVMVPKFIMPEMMQKLTVISPMSWGLDGFLDIFLKSADLNGVITNVTGLVVIGVVSLIISMLLLQTKINKGL